MLKELLIEDHVAGSLGFAVSLHLHSSPHEAQQPQQLTVNGGEINKLIPATYDSSPGSNDFADCCTSDKR